MALPSFTQHLNVLSECGLVYPQKTGRIRTYQITPEFTAMITLEPHEQGTKYTAIVIHGNQEGCKRHEDMGFYDGWGKSLNQLVAYMKQV